MLIGSSTIKSSGCRRAVTSRSVPSATVVTIIDSVRPRAFTTEV